MGKGYNWEKRFVIMRFLGYQERSREDDIDGVLVRMVTLQAMCVDI